ncbi:oligosaccharide flippase family protein [Paenibacillus sp. 2TAF8]|uniref:oligosaccharide flippase family protein n=1 Tax=Paenibacillus sp. 2TAF8 TaxID=3233020 RepID=UPI003F9516DF
MNDTKARYRWRVVVFPFFNVLLNAFNFLFHILAGRYLSSEQYGQVNALLALFALLSVVGLSVQLVIAKLSLQRADEAVIPAPRIISLIAIAISILLLLFLSLATKVLESSVLAYLWLVIIVGLHIITSYHRGVMQGKGYLLKLNVNFYAEVGGKLFFVFFFVLCTKEGLNVERLMFTVMMGMLISAIHGYWTSKAGAGLNPRKDSASNLPWNQIAKDLGHSFVLNCCILFFLSVDMLVVHHYLPEQSGEYAVALKYGQLVYFAGFSIITALVPRINIILSHTDQEERGKNKKLTIMITGYTICIFFGLMGYILFNSLWLPQTIPMLFGPDYWGASSILVPIGTVYAIFSVLVFLAYLHMLSGNSRLMVWLIAGAGCIVTVFIFNHRNLMQIVLNEIMVYSLLVLGLLVDWLFYKRKIKVTKPIHLDSRGRRT